MASALAPLQVSVEGFLVLLALFALGLVMIHQGFDVYRVGRLVQNTATETVRAAAVGRTELEGRVVPVGPLPRRPFDEGRCVYVHYRIREERDSGDDEETWATLEDDTWVADFRLDDGTGTVLVEPAVDARFEISDANTTRLDVPAGRSPPSAVRTFLEQGTDVDPSTDRRRRYHQTVIPPGETVYVLGGAEVREAGDWRGEDKLVIRRDDASGRFVISDMPDAQLRETLDRRAPTLILLGLGLSAVALYLLLDQLVA